MKVDFTSSGEFQTALVHVQPGQTVVSDSGAMYRSSPNIDFDVSVRSRGGGILSGLKRAMGGDSFFLSTYKTRCADRDSCDSLSDECEAPTRTGKVNHCIISSEPLQGENVWEELRPGDVVGVDHEMHMVRTTLDSRSLAVVS